MISGVRLIKIGRNIVNGIVPIIQLVIPIHWKYIIETIPVMLFWQENLPVKAIA